MTTPSTKTRTKTRPVHFPFVQSGGRLKRLRRMVVGQLYSFVAPHRLLALEQGTHQGELSRLDRTLIPIVVKRAKRKGTLDSLAHLHQHFWESEDGHEWHTRTEERFYRWFNGHHSVVVDQVAELLKSHPEQFRQLYEIGCGAGFALNEMARRLAPFGIRSFVGIDLSRQQTEKNALRWATPERKFVAADACTFLPAEAKIGSIFVAIGGVMEYLPQNKLRNLYSALAAKRPACIVLVEPISPEHDIAEDPQSVVFGPEMTWSHPHPTYLEAAGFQVRFREEQRIEGVRWLLIVATCGVRDEP